MDLTQFSTLILIAVFVFSTAAIWIAGMKIISAIDAITLHFSLGEAFGGMVFLAVVTNLPEIAITAVAAYHHDYDIAVSNLLGGIAIQTVVLVLIDFFGVGRKAPLTLKGHSKVLVLEGVSLIFILTIVMMAKQFSPNLIYLRSTPFDTLSHAFLPTRYIVLLGNRSHDLFYRRSDRHSYSWICIENG